MSELINIKRLSEIALMIDKNQASSSDYEELMSVLNDKQRSLILNILQRNKIMSWDELIKMRKAEFDYSTALLVEGEISGILIGYALKAKNELTARSLNFDKVIKFAFQKFCKKTGRSGGVLAHSSITEWHQFLSKELNELYKPL